MGIKYSCDETIFKTLTPSSAYLLGYIYADGNILYTPYNRGKYIKMVSIDPSLIVQAKKILNSDHRISTERPYGQRKKKYILRIGSHELFSDLVKLGVTENKSLTITLPNLPKTMFHHFLRGYFDGDGSIGVYGDKNRKHKRLSLTLTSGSKNFLAQLSNYLQRELGIKLPHLYNGRRCFVLKYSTADSLKIFSYMYNSHSNVMLKRKFDTFKGFLSLYEKWQNDDIIKLLKL